MLIQSRRSQSSRSGSTALPHFKKEKKKHDQKKKDIKINQVVGSALLEVRGEREKVAWQKYETRKTKKKNRSHQFCPSD